MKGKIRGFFLITFAFLFTSVSRAQDIVVIVNPNVQIPQITSAELHDIFLGVRSTFRDRSRAVPVVLRGGPVHEVFLHNHVGQTPDEFRTFWRKILFAGQGVPPKEFPSEAALVQFVKETPGAIGYVSRIADAGDVKILSVQKKSQ